MTAIERVVLMQNHLGELGGVSTFCQLIAPGFLERGYTVEIGAVTPPATGDQVEFDSRIVTWELLDTPNPPPPENVEGSDGERQMEQYRALAKARTDAMLAQAEERFRAFGPETVVVFTQLYARERANVRSLSLHTPTGYHTVGQYHSSFVAARDGWDLGRSKKVYSDLDKFLSLTAEDANWFRKSGFNNTGFIRNPIAVPTRVTDEDPPRRVVSVSRYDPKKGLDQLIRAWSELGDRVAGWRLELYGEGPDRGRLEGLIDTLRLAESVELKGFTSDPLAELSRSALHVLPSKVEGLPFSLLEASALGVPSVAYGCSPGVSDIVEDGVSGYVVPVNRQHELAEAIGSLIDSPSTRSAFSKAGVRHVREYFRPAVVLDEWEKLFNELVL